MTTLRAGKELNEAAFQEKKALSEEAVETIRKTIDEQQKTMLELKSQLKQTDVTGEGNLPLGDGGLVGHQVSLDRKLGLLASVQQGLTGVTSSINALVEQYPFLDLSLIHISNFSFIWCSASYTGVQGELATASLP